ncbi:MAG: DUF4153 domain-containing protein [bacterium]
MQFKKLFSLKNWSQSILNLLARFPVSVGILLTINLALLLLINIENQPQSSYQIAKVIGILSLSLLSSIGIKLYAQSRMLNLKAQFIAQGFSLLLGLIYFLILPSNDALLTTVHYLIFAILAVAITLLSSIAPVVLKNSNEVLWIYTWKMFVRLFFTALFFGVLAMGVNFSIFAITFLFSILGDYRVALSFSSVILGLLAPLFFLSGFPTDFSKLEKDFVYPKFLDIFNRYILFPIISIFLVILYAYGLKVLFTWSWPNGQLVYLVISFLIPALLCANLFYLKLSSSKVIKILYKAIYALILPLIALYFVAIWLRINEYGITESRYYVVLIGIWFAVISVYFLVAKKPLLKVYHLSIVVLALISIIGPWSSYALSRNDQAARLQKLLENKSILVGGKLQKVDPKNVSDQDQIQISSQVQFLQVNYDYNFATWLDEKLVFTYQNTNKFDKSKFVVESMGLIFDPYNYFINGPKSSLYSRSSQPPENASFDLPLPFRVSGFDLYWYNVTFDRYNPTGSSSNPYPQSNLEPESGKKLTLKVLEKAKIELKLDTKQQSFTKEFDLNEDLIKTNKDKTLVKDIIIENKRVKIYFINISYTLKDGNVDTIEYVSCDILVG